MLTKDESLMELHGEKMIDTEIVVTDSVWASIKNRWLAAEAERTAAQAPGRGRGRLLISGKKQREAQRTGLILATQREAAFLSGCARMNSGLAAAREAA